MKWYEANEYDEWGSPVDWAHEDVDSDWVYDNEFEPRRLQVAEECDYEGLWQDSENPRQYVYWMDFERP